MQPIRSTPTRRLAPAASATARGCSSRRVVVAVVSPAARRSAGADSDPGAGYRTAKVATQAVDEVLDAVATVEPVSQATVAFPVAGTVAQVDVAVGDTVAVGDRWRRSTPTPSRRRSPSARPRSTRPS